MATLSPSLGWANTHDDNNNDTNKATLGNSSLTLILAHYRTATSSFLLRQLAVAYATSLEALALLSRTNHIYGLDQAEDTQTLRSFFVLKQKLWVLNSTIFGAILADQEGSVVDNNTGQDGYTRKVRRQLTRVWESGKESPELLVQDLWRRLVDDYGGVEGDVDGQVMVSM